MNETDVSMDISEHISLWKEQAKCERLRHQKRPFREHGCFPDRVRAENFFRSTDWALKVHLA